MRSKEIRCFGKFRSVKDMLDIITEDVQKMDGWLKDELPDGVFDVTIRFTPIPDVAKKKQMRKR